jgi:aminoglycoside phosphotransferase (APT) family kinase protein
MPPLALAPLSAWPGLEVDASPFGTGLINDTFRGSLAGRSVLLQRLHPVFGGSVHEDIEAVTAHLAAKGVTTPRLLRTASGALYADDAEGRPWRVQTFLEGSQAYDRLATPALLEEAGALVGRYHRATADLDHHYVHVRPLVHDVPARATALDAAIAAHGDHRLRPSVDALVRALDAMRPELLPLGATRARHAHGDLKASNLLFDAQGRGLALVDLDTVAAMQLPFELGDALRSWCNPSGEDERLPRFEAGAFEHALRGWAREARALEPTRDEIEAIALGVQTIAAELAVRFATDALEERYFGWNSSRFATRGEHNLARARGQLALAESVRAQRGELDRIARRAIVG